MNRIAIVFAPRVELVAVVCSACLTQAGVDADGNHEELCDCQPRPDLVEVVVKVPRAVLRSGALEALRKGQARRRL